MSDKAQKTIRIKWVRSGIGFTHHQKPIVRSLGLNKLNQVVERPDTPQIRGIVAAVPHLLEIVAAAPAPAWTLDAGIHGSRSGEAPRTAAHRDCLRSNSEKIEAPHEAGDRDTRRNQARIAAASRGTRRLNRERGSTSAEAIAGAKGSLKRERIGNNYMATHIGTLRPPRGANKRPKRIGQGMGSGHGKTATRGSKGQRSRAGRACGRVLKAGRCRCTAAFPSGASPNFQEALRDREPERP